MKISTRDLKDIRDMLCDYKLIIIDLEQENSKEYKEVGKMIEKIDNVLDKKIN